MPPPILDAQGRPFEIVSPGGRWFSVNDASTAKLWAKRIPAQLDEEIAAMKRLAGLFRVDALRRSCSK